MRSESKKQLWIWGKTDSELNGSNSGKPKLMRWKKSSKHDKQPERVSVFVFPGTMEYGLASLFQ